MEEHSGVPAGRGKRLHSLQQQQQQQQQQRMVFGEVAVPKNASSCRPSQSRAPPDDIPSKNACADFRQAPVSSRVLFSVEIDGHDRVEFLASDFRSGCWKATWQKTDILQRMDKLGFVGTAAEFLSWLADAFSSHVVKAQLIPASSPAVRVEDDDNDGGDAECDLVLIGRRWHGDLQLRVTLPRCMSSQRDKEDVMVAIAHRLFDAQKRMSMSMSVAARPEVTLSEQQASSKATQRSSTIAVPGQPSTPTAVPAGAAAVAAVAAAPAASAAGAATTAAAADGDGFRGDAPQPSDQPSDQPWPSSSLHVEGSAPTPPEAAAAPAGSTARASSALGRARAGGLRGEPWSAPEPTLASTLPDTDASAQYLTEIFMPSQTHASLSAHRGVNESQRTQSQPILRLASTQADRLRQEEDEGGTDERQPQYQQQQEQQQQQQQQKEKRPAYSSKGFVRRTRRRGRGIQLSNGGDSDGDGESDEQHERSKSRASNKSSVVETK